MTIAYWTEFSPGMFLLQQSNLVGYVLGLKEEIRIETTVKLVSKCSWLYHLIP
jgi:hypothetical protein